MTLAILLACAEPPPPDVLLFTLDTTRADALGVYGATPSPTPRLDAIAAGGVRFEEAQSVTPLTLPAHGSIHTGLYPWRHGVRRNAAEGIPAATVTLAEVLSGAGWRTGAFVSAVILDASYGLDAGFERYEDETEETVEMGVATRDCTETVAAFATWLAQSAGRGPEPLFAWLHFYDPHLPNARTDPAFRDPYLAEVAHMDGCVGSVLDSVAQVRGDRPRVVVVGDHGEGRTSHGETTHGLYVYRATTRVPFLVSAPGLGPDVVRAPVSLVDVAPTLLGLLDVTCPPDLDGIDLFGGVPPRAVLAETWVPRFSFGLSELTAIQDDRWRYVRAPRPELYDWRADPGEEEDLVAREPEVVRRLAAALEQAVPDGAAPASLATSPASLAGRLEALGYSEAPAFVPATQPGATLPDPKDHPDVIERVQLAIFDARLRPPAEGIPILEAALSRYPGAGSLRMTLSRALELEHRWNEAVAVVGDPAGDVEPTRALRVAEIRLSEGRYEEVERILREIGVRMPEHPGPLLGLAELRRRQGRTQEAEQFADDGLARFPDNAQLLLVKAACRLDTDDSVQAVRLLERSLEIDPSVRDTRRLLASVYASHGDVPRAVAALDDQLARWPADAETRAWRSRLLLATDTSKPLPQETP